MSDLREQIPTLLQFLSTIKETFNKEETRNSLGVLYNYDILSTAYTNKIFIHSTIVSKKICAHCCKDTDNEYDRKKKHKVNKSSLNDTSISIKEDNQKNSDKKSDLDSDIKQIKRIMNSNKQENDILNSKWMNNISRSSIQKRFRNSEWRKDDKPIFRSERAISLGMDKSFTLCRNCGYRTFRGAIEKPSKMEKLKNNRY